MPEPAPTASAGRSSAARPVAVLTLFQVLGPIRLSVLVLVGLACVGWLAIAIIFGAIPVGPNLTNRIGGVGAGDFMFFYPAGVLASEGRAESVYDADALTSVARERMGPQIPELVWPYPPTMSLVLAPLGLASPAQAYAIWMALQVLAIVCVGRLALGRWDAALWALLFPGVALALFAGQFSAVLGLFVAGWILWLQANPRRAGAVLGLLILKPHFGLAPALLAVSDRRWYALGAAALTGGAIVGLSLLSFGAESWTTFFASGVRHWDSIAEEAPLSRFVSVFAAAATAGLPISAALGIHSVAAMFACVASRDLWVRSREPGIRAFALVCATLLLPPYAVDYDLVFLLLPWLLLARSALASPQCAIHLFSHWIALTVLVPLTYLIALYAHQSVGGPLLWLLLVAVWRGGAPRRQSGTRS